MDNNAKSIRPFIGAKNYELSRSFYRDMGFSETTIHAKMVLFTMGTIGFYLQDAYVQDWIDNTMVFVEVADVHQFYKTIQSLGLESRYENVRLMPIRNESWGSECFVHDPSGVLWHFGTFKNSN